MQTIKTDTSLRVGVCRCCLENGCFKDIGTEYSWMGDKENYGNMLAECFSLKLPEVQLMGNACSLICEVCITRLRDACIFRKQIVSTDLQIRDQATRGRLEVLPVKRYLPADGVKVEKINDSEDVFFEIEYLEEDDDVSINDKKAKKEPVKRQSLKRPSRTVTTSNIKKRNLSGSAKGGDTLEAATENIQFKESMTNKTPQKSIDVMMKMNAGILVLNSNMCPFRWHRNHYTCLCCDFTYPTILPLRKHTAENHSKEAMKNKIYAQAKGEIVKVEISDLACDLCGIIEPDFNKFKTHLKSSHNKLFHEDACDGIVPFRLDTNTFNCQLCNQPFHVFYSLNKHMNTHFKKHICEVCGSGFKSKERLRAHKRRHVVGEYKCTVCNKIFTSSQKRKNHTQYVHEKLSRLSCPLCAERFKDYGQRVRHLTAQHGVSAPQFKCERCEKIFKAQNRLREHVKKVHMKGESYECNVCSMRLSGKRELRKHLLDHDGPRTYDCEVCKKTYARNSSLREHMRIHNSDRRFSCDVCGQAFVQKCSLDGHHRTHHAESVVP